MATNRRFAGADRNWIEQTLAGMPTREKLGQLMIPRITPDSVAPYGFAGFVERFRPGGGHLFGGDLETTHACVERMQRASPVPLLITADLERGIGQRIAGSTEFAGQMALGACDDEALASRFGEALAVEGRAAGINWSFGPVVDLSLDPANVGHTRCLGSVPEKVGRLAGRIIHGMQANGLAATAKHLPGAGTCDLDSHLTTPVNRQSREDWFRTSGLPLKMAVDAGVWTMMSSPHACPGIDPECGNPLFPRPVMVSRHVCTGIVRDAWGFDGVLVTDAVTMAGLTMHERRLPMHLACLNAGNDMLLFVRRLDSLYDYLEQCLDDGRLARDRLNTAVRRVLALKARLRLHRGAAPMPLAESRRVFATSPYGRAALQLAERSITLLRDSRDIVPLPRLPGRRVLTVLVTNRPDFDLTAFNDGLQAAGCLVTGIKNPAQGSLYDRIEGGEWDLIVVAFYYPPQWGWSTARCHGPESRCLMDGFPFANPDVPAVFVSFANPYHLYEFGFMDPYLNAYGGCAATQTAAARALLGQIPILGVSPVALEPHFRTGDGIRRSGTHRGPRLGTSRKRSMR